MQISPRLEHTVTKATTSQAVIDIFAFFSGTASVSAGALTMSSNCLRTSDMAHEDVQKKDLPGKQVFMYCDISAWRLWGSTAFSIGTRASGNPPPPAVRRHVAECRAMQHEMPLADSGGPGRTSDGSALALVALRDSPSFSSSRI